MARLKRAATRLSQSLTWWRDHLEHWGFLGWHRDLWLRSITAERAIDELTDDLLRRLKASRSLAPAARKHLLDAERDLGRLRAQR